MALMYGHLMLGLPQIIVAVWLLFGLMMSVFKTGRNREISSGMAATSILLSMAEIVGVSLLLYAGGFW